jgi:hypothetical protein
MPLQKKVKIKMGEFFGIFLVHYSTLLHLSPLRLHCVGECCDRTQDCLALAGQLARLDLIHTTKLN